ncbi:hypothetical protein DM860_000343 [Cuscuta australis]|uniref:Uncharacterized protein n=1 Tax=Cuscuta australis TaxID=267555 RepID=A0A328CZX6_9ASTE|nr:hypothetical protein DM860_000343 [Cuscuta australis]
MFVLLIVNYLNIPIAHGIIAFLLISKKNLNPSLCCGSLPCVFSSAAHQHQPPRSAADLQSSSLSWRAIGKLFIAGEMVGYRFFHYAPFYIFASLRTCPTVVPFSEAQSANISGICCFCVLGTCPSVMSFLPTYSALLILRCLLHSHFPMFASYLRACPTAVPFS